jgi:predicted XRE-type DNA-binding protein
MRRLAEQILHCKRGEEEFKGAAALQLGVARPRLNDLLQGKLGKFSIDAPVNLATAAGLTLEIHLAAVA